MIMNLSPRAWYVVSIIWFAPTPSLLVTLTCNSFLAHRLLDMDLPLQGNSTLCYVKEFHLFELLCSLYTSHHASTASNKTY